jgi:hypothetical protein
MFLWQLVRGLSKVRKEQKDRIEKKIYALVNHADTVRRTVKDFKNVHQYLSSKFPQIDVTDVPIYVVSSGPMNNAGFKGVGGFFIHHLNVIVVRKRISSCGRAKGTFEKIMQEYSRAHIDREDVVVHELIHAISAKINRSSRHYSHMEEEFVYTNCVDFYKNKGMTEADIEHKNFLPFCINDVYQDKNFLSKQCSIPLSDLSDTQELNDYFDEHAEYIVLKIIEKAKEKARRMMDLYDEYNGGIPCVSVSPEVNDDIRLSTLDFN